VNSSGIYTNLWTVGRRATTEGGGYFYIAYTFKGSGISFYNEASHKFVILPNGYVGIGVINPSYRLQLPNTASNAGRAQANRWDTYSSIRWKENIFPITQALDKINQLNGVYFDWKKEYGGKPDIGFIAEEVGKVIPELVSWTADGQYAESLNYDHLTALNLQGIKELETIIKEQQKQIDELKLGIEELRNLVNSKQ
ncbi:MAG: tail fiber domain-containing protein, partial [Patescibacteria group bacterium]